MVGDANAQAIVIDNLAGNSLERMRRWFDASASPLQNAVQNTFYYLALIELSWTMMLLIIRNAGLQQFISVLVVRIMYIGIFAWLLNQGSATVVSIFMSFEDLAIATGMTDGNLQPGHLFDRGLELYGLMYRQATDVGVFEVLTNPATTISESVLTFIIGIGVFIALAFIAAHYAVVLLETFIVANAGIILLAFGGSSWTSGYAKLYLRYAFSAGVKLFLLSLVAGVIVGEIDGFLNSVDGEDMARIISLAAFILFSLVLVIMLPRSARGLVDGVSVGDAGSAASAAGGARKVADGVSSTSGQVKSLFK